MKKKIIIRNDVKFNFGIPKSLYVEFQDLYEIEKRKRKNKLYKRDFILEIIKKGVREWFNK